MLRVLRIWTREFRSMFDQMLYLKKLGVGVLT